MSNLNNIKILPENYRLQKVILRGDKIVLPKSLQDKVVKIAQEGNHGLVKTKKFLRSRVWFPIIDEKVSAVVGPCVARQATVNTPSLNPIKYTASGRSIGEVSDRLLWTSCLWRLCTGRHRRMFQIGRHRLCEPNVG